MAGVSVFKQGEAHRREFILNVAVGDHPSNGQTQLLTQAVIARGKAVTALRLQRRPVCIERARLFGVCDRLYK